MVDSVDASGAASGDPSGTAVEAEVKYTGIQPESWMSFAFTVLGSFLYFFMLSCSFYYSWNTMTDFGYGWLMTWSVSIGCGVFGFLGMFVFWLLKLFRVIKSQI